MSDKKNETMFVGSGIVYPESMRVFLDVTVNLLWAFLKTTAKHLIIKWFSKKNGVENTSIRLEMFPCKEPTKYRTHWVIIHDPENNQKSTEQKQPVKVNEHEEDLPF